MSASEKIPVSISTGRIGTEIFVIDGAWNRVAKGSSSLQTELTPGLYIVRFQIGDQITEQPLRVRPDSGKVEIQGDVPFATSSPLSGTRTSHEYHQYSAQEISKHVRDAGSYYSEIFLFVRDLNETLDPKEMARVDATEPPATGVTLRDTEGVTVLDLMTQGEHSDPGSIPDQWSGAAVCVKPGEYRLHVALSAEEAMEMTVFACPGWQTQVFLTRALFSETKSSSRSSGRVRLRANMNEASVSMKPQGEGFHPDSEQAHAAEIARQALATGKATLDDTVMDTLLNGKYEDPMLGIYGLHALAMAPTPDLDRMRIVASNLTNLIGAHPDVESVRVAFGLEPVAQGTSFTSPPMLRSSARLLIDATIKQSSLVPADSLFGRASANFCGGGVWAVWPSPLPAPVSQDAGLESYEAGTRSIFDLPRLPWPEHYPYLMQLLSPLAQLGFGKDDSPSIDKFSSEFRLDRMEMVLISYVTGALELMLEAGISFHTMADLLNVLMRREPRFESTLASVQRYLSEERVVAQLGVPVATLRRTVGSLGQKLERIVPPSFA